MCLLLANLRITHILPLIKANYKNTGDECKGSILRWSLIGYFGILSWQREVMHLGYEKKASAMSLQSTF